MILNLVNELGRMFQTHTYGDAFCLDIYLCRSEIAVYIAGTMTCCQDNRSAISFLSTRSQIHGFYAYHPIASCSIRSRQLTFTLKDQTNHLGLEMHFAATLDDGVAHVFNDAWQLVGTDMRMGICQDIGIGTMLAEYVQNLVYTSPFLASGIEFAVTISTGSTFTETVVALPIYLLSLGNVREVLLAFAHIFASLQHDRTVTQFYQAQGSEEAARSLTHNDNPRSAAHIRVFGMDILVVLRKFVDISTHLQIDEDGALTGIDASLQNPHLVERSYIQSLFFGEITLDAFLACCLFGQNSYLILLNHYTLYFEL